MTPIIVFLMVTFVCYGASTPEGNVISSSNRVSHSIYKILGRSEENVLFCPVSANIPLSLVYLAARGNTATELRASLNLSSDATEVKSGYYSFIKSLNGNTLKLATSLYPRKGLTLSTAFLDTAQRHFDSVVEQIDYTHPDRAANTINSFVEQKTNNKIHNLIDSNKIDRNTAMIIVNAAHFKDNWKNPFYNTFESQFFTSNNEKVKVEMMMETEHFKFKDSDSLKAKVIQLPFQEDHYSMVIVLPREVNGLQELEAKLTSFNEVLTDLTYKRVTVKLPKFKIEATLDLKAVLQTMGIKSLFTDESDLTGLAEGQDLAVSDVIQKTYIEVNENGVEAAAATAAGIMTLSAISYAENPQEFTADHPFLFAIMRHKLIIFQGRMAKI